MTKVNVLCTVLFVAFSNNVLASPNNQEDARPKLVVETAAVSLEKFANTSAKALNTKLFLDSTAPADIVAQGVHADDISIDDLAQILSLNQLALVRVGEGYHIVPEKKVRVLALPVLNNTSPEPAEWEWVTKAVNTHTLDSEGLLPILRPLVPQMAHMAAKHLDEKGNFILLTAPYSVVKRIEQVVAELEKI